MLLFAGTGEAVFGAQTGTGTGTGTNALVLENAGLKVIVDAGRLALTIEDKSTGYVWKHDPGEASDLNKTWRNYALAGAVIDVAKSGNESQVPFEGDAKLSKDGDDIVARLNFGKTGVSLDVVYHLNADSLSVSVPFKSIREKKTQKLQRLTLYPFMGASRGIAEGFIFVPDGSGALIDLSRSSGATQPFAEPVYGTDIGFYGLNALRGRVGIESPETVSVPVYGIGYGGNGNALMSTIAGGAEHAVIKAYTSGITTPYNWTCATFVYRDFYYQLASSVPTYDNSIKLDQEKPNEISPELIFTPLSGGEANYSGMAERTRAAYTGSGILTPMQGAPGGGHVTILAADNEKSLFGRKAIVVTDAEQATDIVKSLREIIPEGLRVELTGFEKKGLTSSPAVFGKTEGSKSDWTDFIRMFDGTQDRLYPARDYVRVYSRAKGYSKRDVAIGASQQLSGMNDDKNIPSGQDQAGRRTDYNYYRFLHPDATLRIADKDAQRLRRLGAGNLSLGTMGMILNSAYGKHSATREEAIAVYRELLKANDDFGYALNAPGAYLWGCSDTLFDLPVSDSGYTIESEPVPFLQLVLSGSAELYGPDINDRLFDAGYLMKLLEYGMNPSWLLTGENPSLLSNTDSRWILTSRWGTWESRIREQVAFMKAGADATRGARLTDHRKIEEGVYESTFDNDMVLITNYSEAPYIMRDKTVESGCYAVTVAVTGE
jgi:hypothetical protein